MAFFRGANTVTPEEALVFNYWILTIQLLKRGNPWDTLQRMTEDEIHLVLGIDAAMSQREEDEQTRSMGSSMSMSNLGGFN